MGKSYYDIRHQRVRLDKEKWIPFGSRLHHTQGSLVSSMTLPSYLLTYLFSEFNGVPTSPG